MKTILPFVICIIIFSCSKNNETVSNTVTPPPASFVDTLATGWSKMYLPSQFNLDIYFSDNDTGYIAGSADLFKTNDGGITWTSIASLVNNQIYNISATPGGKIFLINKFQNIVFSTDNGGISFDTTYLTSSHVPLDAYFINNDTGYLIGRRELFKTIDAGVTWTSSLPAGLFYTEPATSSLFFLNNTTGWIVNGDSVYRSNGSADNWSVATFNIAPSSNFSSVFATNATVVYAATRSGQVYKSINGGLYFSLLITLPGKEDYADIQFIDSNTGYVCHANKIYKTTDAGSSWQNVVTIAQDIWEIHFNDLNHVWASGDSGVVLTYHQ